MLPRLLLKLSGEALGGDSGQGIDPAVLEHFCRQIQGAVDAGIELGVVLGGGNLFRGAALSAAGMDRVVGDRMGMLATVMNALALGDFLTRQGIANQVYSATGIPSIVPTYERDQALGAIAQGTVVILSGGTGNPLFTTDTAACLRGIELGADAVLKATNVDGVYSADPKKDPSATRYTRVTFDQVLEQQLGVMDLTAMVLCRDYAMPIVVFDVQKDGALLAISEGADIGTRVEV
ncbi:MAG TPA: UMP kinase [Gammaproteobacteria bacterium]|nr:UMP kinase [Gammaproteobacteria bacterium]